MLSHKAILGSVAPNGAYLLRQLTRHLAGLLSRVQRNEAATYSATRIANRLAKVIGIGMENECVIHNGVLTLC